MADNLPEPNGRWRFDHKIPISLLLGLAVQAAVLLIWGAKLDGSVDGIDRRVTALERISKEAQDDRQRVGERLAVIETTITSIKSDSADSKRLLERIEGILISGGKNP